VHEVAQVIIPPKEGPFDVDEKNITASSRSPAVEAHVNPLVEESDLVTLIWNGPALLLMLSDDKMIPPEGSNSPEESTT
jgi:hypothetical protein